MATSTRSWVLPRVVVEPVLHRPSGDRERVILGGMTHRVGPKGQVVIPKELRDELGIHPGDEVTFWLDDDHVAVRPTSRRRPLKGRFAGSDLVAELTRERTRDRRREDDT
jgi:AbrB family looped-hinge helix DNA binding protein